MTTRNTIHLERERLMNIFLLSYDKSHTVKETPGERGRMRTDREP